MTLIRTTVRVVVSLSLLAAALGAPACGDSDDDAAGRSALAGAATAAGSEREIGATLRAVEDAIWNGKVERACSLLTPRAVRQIGTGVEIKSDTCRAIVAATSRNRRDDDRPKLSGFDVRPRGDGALLTVKTDRGAVQTYRMVTADGRWKVDQAVVQGGG